MKFYGRNDLLLASDLEKAVPILESFDENKNFTDINEIVELYEINLLMNCGVRLSEWEEEKLEVYKNSCKLCMKTIGKFFSGINNKNFIEICNAVCIGYIEDYWKLIVKFNVYKKISGETFEKYLRDSEIAFWVLLREEKLVKHYGQELARCLRNSDQTAELIIDKYLKRHDQ